MEPIFWHKDKALEEVVAHGDFVHRAHFHFNSSEIRSIDCGADGKGMNGELYKRVETKDGENSLYRLDTQGHWDGKDIQ